MMGFEAKVRKVGNSKGILLPREVAQEVKLGQTLRLAVYPDPKRKLKALEESSGILRGTPRFTRDHVNRY
ncbi:MAG: hypothetical protein HY558_07350 [Euryarchaeota archaeon]|nr:hypothetical protein [Euryarchaeota archaeon]